MIDYCTYKPAPLASHTPPSLRIRFRDFAYVSFHFLNDKEARSAFDCIKNLTAKLGRLEKLFAFHYRPPGPERLAVDGWTLYDPKKEFARLGITEGNTDKGWRITNINADYVVSDSLRLHNNRLSPWLVNAAILSASIAKTALVSIDIIRGFWHAAPSIAPYYRIVSGGTRSWMKAVPSDSSESTRLSCFKPL